MVPLEVVWSDFLRAMHWTDSVVLGKQPHDHVHEQWVIYEWQNANGLLQGMF